jgi:hypothetical protein
MKTYPSSTGHVLPIHARQSSKKFILLILFIALAILSFASGGGKLTFKNSTLISGTAGKDGAIYRFPQVDTDVDALIKIKGRSNSLVYLVTIDMVTSGFDKAWQPQVGYNKGSAPGAADWYMEFEMTFVQKGTNTPVTFDEFDLSAIDIDGNGDKIREYVGFYGLSSYKLETPSILALSDLTGLVGGLTKVIGKRFDGPTLNFNNIDTNSTSVMTTTHYITTQTFSLRAGAVATGANGASERMYSFYFQDFTYNKPAQSTLPVTLKSFDAKLVSNKSVLNWVSAMEINFSHYTLQKSFDGKNFSDVTTIFSTGAQGTDFAYSYSESAAGASGGLIYYRLKMVDIDGAFKYSQVRILKTASVSAGITVSTYPNPVASELRITIPTQWQDQKVVYDMYSTSGKMVKRYVSNRASQTETLNVNDINAGSYVIRLSSGTESAVQQIVKAN